MGRSSSPYDLLRQFVDQQMDIQLYQSQSMFVAANSGSALGGSPIMQNQSSPRPDFSLDDRVQHKSDRKKVPLVGTVVAVRAYTYGNDYEVKWDDGNAGWLSQGYLKKAAPPAPKIKVSFDSVILDDEKKKSILDAVNQVDNHKKIFEDWGFAEVFEKGTAISMLFYGEPGTGKTLMAQALADKLRLELKVIGNAEIDSPMPGQAERSIKAFFKESKGKLLLFDECDSLVFDRAGVGSILAAQVNALLTSLETYEGVVVFTTNRLGTLDPAFNRRLSLKVEFDLPNQEQRVQIWKRMFPTKAPVAKDVDWEALAEFEITGGYIKNAVLRAARAAASEKANEIKMKHIAKALKEELKSKNEFESQHESLPRVVSGQRGRIVKKDLARGV